MRWIHANNVFCQSENSLAELVLRHDCAQIAHGLTVLLAVCDCGKRVQAAIVLRERLNVRPCLVFVIVFRHALLFSRCWPDYTKLAKNCAQEMVWREEDGRETTANEVEGHGGELQRQAALSGNDAYFMHIFRTIVTICTNTLD
jgi:hypothetical protein